MVNFLSEFSFYLLLLLILLPRLYIFIDCPNCVDESQYTPNKWTMPLLKLGEKRYYLGIFFKVSRIPWAIGHLQAARKLQLQQRSAICDLRCDRSDRCDDGSTVSPLRRLHILHMVFYEQNI